MTGANQQERIKIEALVLQIEQVAKRERGKRTNEKGHRKQR